MNVADALAQRHEVAGSFVPFENREHRFEEIGFNIQVLEPGQPNGRYHREGVQEGFLVLHGECILIVDDQERPMKKWDFFHCPPGTDHIFVGAGDGPCAIVMFGVRPDKDLYYPASELAAKYGAEAPEPTADPDAAYSDWNGELTPTRLDWPLS